MHGENDAFHMFNLHTKLVHNKEILWSELENMIPFQKEAYINILISTIKEENKQPSGSSLEI